MPRDGGVAGTAAAGIPRVSRDGELPLSFAQERLWFLDRLEPGNPFYNVSQAVRLTGALDVAAARGGVAGIARRHEILRTAFVSRDGSPAQRVLPDLRVEVPLVDLSALPEAAREREAERLALRAAHRSFDLSSPPLFGVELYRLTAERHVLTLTLHHIVSDGWSVMVFLSEFAALYRSLAAGEAPRLPELAAQYLDFAQWQRGWLRQERVEEQLAYWRRQLAAPLPVLDLPTDRPRPAVQTFQGGSEIVTLPADVVAGLKALCHREGATLFMGLLATFVLMLSRYSGQEDVLVGAPVAGRNRRELEGLIGVFLNTLVLRTSLAGASSFREILGRVRETSIAAFSRQDVPIEKLLADLQPQRDLSRASLFQVMFNMQDFPSGSFELPGLTLTSLPLREVPSKFDLTVYAAEVRGEVLFELVYNAGLFDRATARGFLDQLRHLLPQLVDAPEESPGRFSLVPPEMAAMLPDPTLPLVSAGWTGAAHERFAEQARREPARAALVFGGETWTYGRLDAASARLAGRLLAAGIGREDVVAVHAERGPELVRALLGVLRAGAAFMVLDPAYPAARLLEILQLAQPRAVVAASLPEAPAAARAVDGGGGLPRRPGGGRGRRRARRGVRRRGLSRRSGLRGLHLRLDGPAQGDSGRARAALPLHRLARPRARLRRGGPFQHALGPRPRSAAARRPHPAGDRGHALHSRPGDGALPPGSQPMDGAAGGHRLPSHSRPRAGDGGSGRGGAPDLLAICLLRRRSADRGARLPDAPARARSPVRQLLRRHGDPPGDVLAAGFRRDRRRRADLDRPGDRRRRAPDPQRGRPAGRPRGAGRGPRPHAAPRPRLPRGRAAHPRAFPPQPVRRRRRRPPVPDRRSGALPRPMARSTSPGGAMDR